MKTEVDFSIIVPVYNGGNYLATTIESVLLHSQGYSVECIVINDGSTDQTAEILKEFKDQVKVVTQENGGESAAVNRGLNEASGEGIMVVSADDPLLTSQIFEGMRWRLEEEPNIVAWYPDWNVIDDLGLTKKRISLPEYDFKDLFEKNIVLPGPGTWFRRSAALAIGGRNPRWRYVGDYDFWLRLSLVGEFKHRPQVLAQWRSHSGSTSISERGYRMAKERIAVIEEFISDNTEKLSAFSISLARANAHYLAARLGYFSPEVHSRKLFFRSVRLNFKVIKFKRLHEMIFMITFPLSKKLIDKIRNIL